MIKDLLLTFLLLLLFNSLFGQFGLETFVSEEHDSTYYDDLDGMLTVKAFSAQKFSDFAFEDDLIKSALRYEANTTNSLGFGLNYKWIGVNFGYGFSFVNNDDELYGKTERFDLQTDFHLRKLTIRMYASRYQGYYLNNSYNVINDWQQHTYYKRPDIANASLGLTVNYIFNSKKYSNRAAYSHNEWQKKTAGSFFVGGSIFYNHLSADSSFTPTNIKDPDFFRGAQWDRNNYSALGANAGYVFTWVVHEHFFINAGLALGLAAGSTSIHPIQGEKISKFKLKANLINNFGMGYNSELFYVGIGYNNFISTSPTPIDDTNVSYSAGYFMFGVAYRIQIKNHETFLPRIFP